MFNDFVDVVYRGEFNDYSDEVLRFENQYPEFFKRFSGVWEIEKRSEQNAVSSPKSAEEESEDEGFDITVADVIPDGEYSFEYSEPIPQDAFSYMLNEVMNRVSL